MSDNNRNGQDPWGRRPNDGPPDLLALLKRFFGQSKKRGPVGSSGGDGSLQIKSSYFFIALGVAFLLWVLSGIFVVSPQEQAVVLRFGRYASTVGPGPHWIPRGIDRETVVNVQQISNFKYQSHMLTQDENIVSVSLAVQYRIDNAKNYLFNVVNPELTLRQATSSVLRQVVGQMTLDSILTTGREVLSEKVSSLLKEVLEQYHAGLNVRDVTLQPAKPPAQVLEAFDDVNKARENAHEFVNKANTYRNKRLSIVKGDIVRIMQKAKAYAAQVVQTAKGTTARYLALLAPYQKAPKVTRERLYIDAMQNVLSRTSNIVVDTKGSNNVLYLPIDRMLKQSTLGSSESSPSMPETNIATPDLSVKSASADSAVTQRRYPLTRPSYAGASS